MKKKSATRKTPETQLLELLQQVLPSAAPDPELAGRIYQAVETALTERARRNAFEEFCAQLPLLSLESDQLEAAREQLEAAFGEGEIRLEPDAKGNRLAVEITLPDGRELTGAIPVNPDAASEAEATPRPKFVPFPVALAGDPELIWLLAREENLTADEAEIALHTLEGDYWASKTGQRLLRQRVERGFPEFIARVPAKLLREAGLRRHYKEPEPVKIHRPDLEGSA